MKCAQASSICLPIFTNHCGGFTLHPQNLLEVLPLASPPLDSRLDSDLLLKQSRDFPAGPMVKRLHLLQDQEQV